MRPIKPTQGVRAATYAQTDYGAIKSMNPKDMAEFLNSKYKDEIPTYYYIMARTVIEKSKLIEDVKSDYLPIHEVCDACETEGFKELPLRIQQLEVVRLRIEKFTTEGTYKLQDLYNKQDRKCNTCEIYLPLRLLDVDHIIPKSKDGPDTADNVQLLCKFCNNLKGNKDNNHLIQRIEALRELGYLDDPEFTTANKFPTEEE